jgi:hypothetical protein
MVREWTDSPPRDTRAHLTSATSIIEHQGEFSACLLSPSVGVVKENIGCDLLHNGRNRAVDGYDRTRALELASIPGFTGAQRMIPTGRGAPFIACLCACGSGVSSRLQGRHLR